MTTTSGNLPRLWTMCHVERADIWVNTKLRSPVPVPTDPGGPAGPVGPAGPSGPVGPAGPVAPSSSGLTSAVIHAPPVEVGGRTHALLCLPRPDLGLCDLDPDLVLPRGGLNSQTAHEEDDEQLGQLPSDPDRGSGARSGPRLRGTGPQWRPRRARTCREPTPSHPGRCHRCSSR